jgi:hypothetical protein
LLPTIDALVPQPACQLTNCICDTPPHCLPCRRARRGCPVPTILPWKPSQPSGWCPPTPCSQRSWACTSRWVGVSRSAIGSTPLDLKPSQVAASPSHLLPAACCCQQCSLFNMPILLLPPIPCRMLATRAPTSRRTLPAWLLECRRCSGRRCRCRYCGPRCCWLCPMHGAR